MAESFKILPKWWNFAKSGHTVRQWQSEHFGIGEILSIGFGSVCKHLVNVWARSVGKYNVEEYTSESSVTRFGEICQMVEGLLNVWQIILNLLWQNCFGVAFQSCPTAAAHGQILWNNIAIWSHCQMCPILELFYDRNLWLR